MEAEEVYTVRQLKEACAEGSNLLAEEMRLIFKGKILKDDLTLSEYKIENGMTVHLVKGKSAASATSNSAGQTTATNSLGGVGGPAGT